jgi:hypothetical protein
MGFFHLRHRGQTGCGAHPASSPMGAKGSFSGGGGECGRSVKLTTYLHLVLKLRILGAVFPLPQYGFMAWCLVKQGDIFTFIFTLYLFM